jgi:hypothetical protein
MKSTRRLQVISIFAIATLWALTFAVALAWVFEWPLPFAAEAEPITVVLGLVSTAGTALIGYFGVELRAKEDQLAEEQYSMPMGLAYGYVHNFVAPLVRKLVRDAGEQAAQVKLYVFMPEDLEDLESAAVDVTLAKIRARNYSTKVVKLELESGRPRDVLTVLKGIEAAHVYFDFPNTLLTLKPVVRYKVRSERNESSAAAERELGRRFIKRFQQAVEQEVAALKLNDHVALTDQQLSFLPGNVELQPEADSNPASGS